MTPIEIGRVQAHLRKALDNNRIAIKMPARKGGPVEVVVGNDFLGVLHRDEDEGEVSFDLHISILEEDLRE